MPHDFTDAAGRKWLAQAEADDHRAANPDTPRRGQRTVRKILAAVCAMFIFALAAFHLAPKAIGQAQHDASGYQQ